MKSTFRFFGIIAAVAIIGFSMAGCSTDGGDNGTGNGGTGGNGVGPSHVGPTLNLRGQVWEVDGGWGLDAWNWTQFAGNRTVFSEAGGLGSITAGQLDFSMASPAASSLEDISDHWLFENAEVSNPDARIFYMNWSWNLCCYTLRTDTDVLARASQTASGNRHVFEFAWYIFVDRDVTARIEERSDTDQGEDGFTYSWVRQAFTLDLREGWNVMHLREEYVRTATRATVTDTISAGDPAHLRWALFPIDEWDLGYSGIVEFSSRAQRVRGLRSSR